MAASSRPKIGILALTLEFYETLAPKLRPGREAWLRREVIPALSPDLDVLFDSAVFRREDIEATVDRLEAAGADALLVLLLTYAPSQLALPALRQTRLPIAIWNTQELASVDTDFTVEAMIDNHGVHGTQDLANVLVRSGVRFHYLTGHARDPQAMAQLRDWCAATAAVSHLHHLRIGLVGYPFAGMGDFAVDTTHLVASLGCTWVPISLEEWLDRARAHPADAVADLVQGYRAQYAVAPDVTDVDLGATARMELALRGLVADRQLSAVTYQFLAFGEDERALTLPFVAVSRLMAEGIGFGGEGDLIAAAATTLFHQLQPPATFSEIFTIDFAGNALFLSHMGEANIAMARRDRPIPLVARPTPITRTRERQLALVTSLEPGPATFAALTLGPAQRWRIIASAVTIEDFGPLPQLYVPHFKIRPAGDVRHFLNRYAQAGGPHHNAICRGDARDRLRHTARLLDADYLEI